MTEEITQPTDPNRKIVSVCAICGAPKYEDGAEGYHQSFCCPLRRIYQRMPDEARRLLDAVPLGPTHRKLIELWATVQDRHEEHPHELSGEELTARNTDREDEERIQHALEGKLGEPALKAVTARVTNCTSVAGCTWTALKVNDLGRYRRFLRGATRAILRAGAIKRGDLLIGEIQALRRREKVRRDARSEVDRLGGPVAPPAQDARYP